MNHDNPAQLTHAPFLRAIQEWVWKRFPARQLSPADIFYAMQWAASEIPVSVFIREFEAFLKTHPHHLDDSFRLSKFQFQARQIILSCRQNSQPIVQPVDQIQITDPYQTALTRLAHCGRKTNNELLRDALRIFYQHMRESCKQIREEFPDWQTRPDHFYRLKAQAVMDWDQGLCELCQTCFMALADEEQKQLLDLTPVEKAHLMYLGPDAEKTWRSRRINEKTAAYLGFSELMESL